MDTFDWYYIYSQRYYPFDLYLKDAIPAPFLPKGIFVDQSVFDEHLYKHKGEHFFNGITVKIEAILQILQEKQAAKDTRPFFFTDVDILINSRAATDLLPYTSLKEVDILFQQEYSTGPKVNPGVMLIWPNDACVEFWAGVLEEMKGAKKMEMQVINSRLAFETLRVARFSLEHVCSSITVDSTNLLTYSIYHLLAGANEREEDMKEKIHQATLLGKNLESYYQSILETYGKVFT